MIHIQFLRRAFVLIELLDTTALNGCYHCFLQLDSIACLQTATSSLRSLKYLFNILLVAPALSATFYNGADKSSLKILIAGSINSFFVAVITM